MESQVWSRRSSRRRALALTTCVLWLLGVELLPDLHLQFHADDHTHDASGTITHGHSHTVKRARAQDHHQLAIDLPGSEHAANGISHRTLALHQPPLPLLAPKAVEPIVWQLATAPVDRIYDSFEARPTARGPPDDRT